MKKPIPMQDTSISQSFDEAGIERRMRVTALSGPIFVETFLRMLFLNIDVFMLKYYSEKAVAAMGPIMQFYFLILIMLMVSTSGAGILIAQYLGARRRDMAAEYSLASLNLVTLSGIVIGIVFFIAPDLYLGFYALEDSVHNYALEYMTVMGSAAAALSFSVGVTGIARSYGFTRITLIASIAGNIVNVFGNACFIFGLFGVPVLGVKGVAISTLTGNLFSGVVVYIFLSRQPGFKLPFNRIFRLPLLHYWNILKIGAPSAGEQLSYNLAQMVTMQFISRLGTPSLTAYVCAFNIMRFIFMVSLSIGQAIQILVGYLVGSKRADEAKKRTLTSLRFSVIVTFGIAIAFSIFRESLIRIYTNDPEVIAIAGSLVLMTMILEPSRAFNIILGSALRGAGDYKFPISIGIVFMWGVSVNLAYFLGIRWGMGALGVWIAFTADESLRGALMLWRWLSGIWKTKSIVSSNS